jgi:acetyltransferase
MKEVKYFFNPEVVAVVGASNNSKKVGNVLMRKLKGFKGKVIPINLRGEKILGKVSYKSVLNYPKKIDLAIIATPAKTVPLLLKQFYKKQIKNVIIVSSGFSEVGNFRFEKKVEKLIKKYRLNVLGPNCFGVMNPSKNLDLTFSKESAKKGNVAFISQSGALGSYVFDLGIKLSGFVSVGNMIDLNFSDFIEYFEKDRKTKKIVIYMEYLKEGKRFIDVGKKSKKEIIVVKSGKTEKGKKAALTHTGNLATNSEIYSGAFKQAGIKEVDSLVKAFGLKQKKFPKIGKNVAIITNAGGAGVLISDKLEKQGHRVFGPLDLLGTATSRDYARALHRIKKDFDSIVVIVTPQTMTAFEDIAKVLVDSFYREKIIAVFLGDKSIGKARKILEEGKVSFVSKVL